MENAFIAMNIKFCFSFASHSHLNGIYGILFYTIATSQAQSHTIYNHHTNVIALLYLSNLNLYSYYILHPFYPFNFNLLD